MLKPIRAKKASAAAERFAVIASSYNARYVNSMLRAAKRTLITSGAEVEVVRVPGAFEIPAIAASFAGRTDRPFGAIICLGVILRGETTHAQHIAEAVSHALAQIQIRYHKPVIHEVLLLESEEQAKARCLDQKHNRGMEAALTAIEMARLIKRLANANVQKQR